MKTVPQIIGNRYRLQDVVGVGGMGTVYRAKDTQSGEDVAVKLLKAEAADNNPDLIERFTREAEALRELNHPGIVKVLATVEEDGKRYIVMEYVSGGSLADLLQKHERLPVKRVLEIALDLADALTRAHRLQIIHRDLKPANVMIAHDGTPRLSDFGVARIGAKERVTQVGSVIGTPDYMSPEAFDGDDVDARADIWSFGVMLFEMLAGERPFNGDTVSKLLTAVLTQPPLNLESICPDCPPALVDLVYRMLEKDRNLRVSSVRQVGAELEGILRGTPLTGQTSRPTHAARFAAPSSITGLEAPHHNLPVQNTPFIGRDDELVEITKLLQAPETRLLTLLGPGGIGKTRLSLEVARQQFDHFANGVYFVPLAPHDSPDLIVPALAEALKFSFYGAESPRDQILNFLREKQLLLVMDNFEHLTSGASLIADILQAAPGIKVIASSRERLRLQSEWVYEVYGMKCPEAVISDDMNDYSAVKLFLQSARRVQPGFELNDGNCQDIGKITRMVEGLPLGIELAAAWLETLSPSEIVDEIERSLDFLETDLRDVPERQRSIRAVFEYSWNLLTNDERDAFTKLSVFRDGFTRHAGEKVAAASLRALTTLVNKSLLRRAPDGRYHVHELLRQYALEHLRASGELYEPTLDQHLAYYTAFVKQRESEVTGQNQRTALNEIDIEIENIRAAWGWAVERRKYAELNQILEPLNVFYVALGRFNEGAELFSSLEEKLRAESPNDLLTWRTHMRLGWMYGRMGRYEEGKTCIRRSLEVFRRLDDKMEIVESLIGLCYIAMMQGDYDDSVRYGDEALKLAEEMGSRQLINMIWAHQGYLAYLRSDYAAGKEIYQRLFEHGAAPAQKAYGMSNLGEILRETGDLEQAGQMFREAYTIFKEFGNRRGMGFTSNNLGGIYFRQGDYEQAERHFRESYTISRDIGDRTGIGHALSALGNLAFFLHDYEKAKNIYHDVLAVRREIGNQREIAESLSDLGSVAMALGQVDEGQRYYEEVLAISRRIGDRLGSASALFGLGEIRARHKDADGARSNFEQVLAIAQEVGNNVLIAQSMAGLAEVAIYEGDFDRAGNYYLQVLQMARASASIFIMALSILSFAAIRMARGQLESAVELVALTHQYAHSLPITDEKARQIIARLQDELPPEVYAAAWERGQALDLLDVAEKLLEQGG
jgi:predicted ATPase/Tfp pilus assembly protein PilF/predicted Ser/Thr protein kinase